MIKKLYTHSIAIFTIIALLTYTVQGSFVIPQSIHAQEPTTEAEVNIEDDAEVTSEPEVTPIPEEDLPGVGLRLTISPIFVNLVTDPGEPVESTIKIKNNNNVTEYLTFDFAQYETVDGGENLSLSVLDEDAEFRKWVEFEETNFTLAPSEVKTIDFTITPPDDASLGYYYAIMIRRQQEKEFGQTGASITGIPAFAVLLEVRDPNAKRELQLVDFSTDKFFYEYLPTEFKIVVRNTGNIHLVPFGDIFLDWGTQKDHVIISANPQRGTVIPGQERTITTTWDDGLITRAQVFDENGEPVTDNDGNPTYETKVDFNKPLSTFRIGKYTANLVMIYDNGERDVPLEGTLSFWVIPIKLILALLGLIILPFVIYNIINRIRRKRKAEKKTK